MFYFVMETQVYADGTAAVLPIIKKTDLNAALSEYHRILSAAAVSQVYKHGATIINEDMMQVKRECYKHGEEE